jgi:hypothetical protein
MFWSGSFSQQVTIEILSYDVLLDIFRHYMDRSPKFWSTLAHVCQRWRGIVFASPRSLDLRLYCTYGTPVLKTLKFWPPLPLIMNYGGSPELNPPAPEDDENIVAALKQSDHVRSISLTVTSSLMEKLSTITKSFTELEEIILLSRDNLKLALPGTFRCGPRLRTWQSTRIAIPALPQLLSHPTGLVDLQLHEIPKLGYFCPEILLMHCRGRATFEHFHSTSFPFLLVETNFACPYNLVIRNVLFSLLSLTSNIEELPSSWIVSWLESKHLVSRVLMSQSLANQRWTLRNSADSLSGRKCRFRSFKQTLKSPHMLFLSTLATPELLHLFDFKYRASR